MIGQWSYYFDSRNSRAERPSRMCITRTETKVKFDNKKEGSVAPPLPAKWITWLNDNKDKIIEGISKEVYHNPNGKPTNTVFDKEGGRIDQQKTFENNGVVFKSFALQDNDKSNVYCQVNLIIGDYSCMGTDGIDKKVAEGVFVALQQSGTDVNGAQNQHGYIMNVEFQASDEKGQYDKECDAEVDAGSIGRSK